MKKVSLPFIEFAGAGIHEGIKYRSIVVRRWKSPRLWIKFGTDEIRQNKCVHFGNESVLFIQKDDTFDKLETRMPFLYKKKKKW